MKHKFAVLAAVLAVASVLCWAAESRESTPTIDPVVQGSEKTNTMRLEGEKRFRAQWAASSFKMSSKIRWGPGVRQS